MDSANVSICATLIPLIPVIVGGLIGIVGGVLGPVWLDKNRRRHDRDVLTSCLKAEIGGLLWIVGRRQYLEGLRTLLAEAEDSPNDGAIRSFTFSVRSTPFRIYEANLDRLGLLEKDFARQVVRFYTQGRSILEDIEDMRESQDETAESSLARLRELVPLFAETVELGKQIIGERVTAAP